MNGDGRMLAERVAALEALARQVQGQLEGIVSEARALTRLTARAEICSLNEAARRLGRSYNWLRRLLERDAALGELVLVRDPDAEEGSEGTRMVRWTALERWVAGDLQLSHAAPAPPNVTPLRERAA